jgi:hypothetical protein
MLPPAPPPPPPPKLNIMATTVVTILVTTTLPPSLFLDKPARYQALLYKMLVNLTRGSSILSAFVRRGNSLTKEAIIAEPCHWTIAFVEGAAVISSAEGSHLGKGVSARDSEYHQQNEVYDYAP